MIELSSGQQFMWHSWMKVINFQSWQSGYQVYFEFLYVFEGFNTTKVDLEFQFVRWIEQILTVVLLLILKLSSDCKAIFNYFKSKEILFLDVRRHFNYFPSNYVDRKLNFSNFLFCFTQTLSLNWMAGYKNK